MPISSLKSKLVTIYFKYFLFLSNISKIINHKKMKKSNQICLQKFFCKYGYGRLNQENINNIEEIIKKNKRF